MTCCTHQQCSCRISTDSVDVVVSIVPLPIWCGGTFEHLAGGRAAAAHHLHSSFFGLSAPAPPPNPVTAPPTHKQVGGEGGSLHVFFSRSILLFRLQVCEISNTFPPTLPFSSLPLFPPSPPSPPPLPHTALFFCPATRYRSDVDARCFCCRCSDEPAFFCG